MALATAVAMACSGGPAPRVARAVIVPPTRGAPTAVYLTLANDGGRADSLFGISADGVGEATLVTQQQHRAPTGGAGSPYMALMVHVPSVVVAAGEVVMLSPGGVHGAIDRLRRPLVVGDSVRLTLRLAGGRTASATARVVPFAALDSVLAGHGSGGAVDVAARDGAALYRSNGCASCHGKGGRGDGPVAATLAPPPRDFRDATAFRNGIDTAAIAQTLATGIPGGGSMPLYAHLTLAERRALAGYIIALRAPSPDTSSHP